MEESANAIVRPHDDALIIEVQSKTLDESSTRELVDFVLGEASVRSGVPIVLDLAKVRFAPSVALGALVQMSKSFSFEKRRIALINVHKRITDTIRVTQLHRILELHFSLDDVLKSKPTI
ncbi:MAG TPA: STAS domain-containing protein [Phycisphaerae bacterium]|nr:STAS domain-containing protein [Phycisphaerales bacterium]HNO76790.1 STAS domain-containing protein [Phycisphaerae bacterium]